MNPSGDVVSARSTLLWTLVYGLLWNVLGWLGNNFVLGAAWDTANAQLSPSFSPPYSGLAREVMTLVPDFLFAFVFVWVFGRMRVQTVVSALALAVIVEICVVITYLAMVTSGFLPWQLATQTSVLALAIFLVTAPILPMARRRREAVAAN
jgi:hypothetical protein